MVTLYRIFTERKRKDFLRRLFAESFDGFTMYDVEGNWQGKKEKSLVIEVLTNSTAAELLLVRTCKAICGYNKQDAVLVQKITSNRPMRAYLITSAGRRDL